MKPALNSITNYANPVLIRGVGIDIVEVSRIRVASSRWGDRFEGRIYTPEEIKYCGGTDIRYQRLAARFAAKEAAFKALGTGLRPGMWWHDVSVITGELGKPELILNGRARQHADSLGVSQTFVTLAHTDNYAVANVILWGELQ
ncbi:MAG: holo-ACP synthase [Candidatus Poribacteria bacterium]|nr:holo-ACP synthase [Candidatus Poribacteria bacterium]